MNDALVVPHQLDIFLLTDFEEESDSSLSVAEVGIKSTSSQKISFDPPGKTRRFAASII
jgi:hypothetical protein